VTTAIPPAPSQVDPTVGRASAVIGGPLGRYALPARRWTVVRILLAVAAITMLLGYAEKAPCASGRWVNNLQYTHACYSDVIPLWGAEGLSDGAVPYRDHAVEYPVLTGGFMWVTAELTRGWHSLAEDGYLPGTDETVVFGFLTCLLLAGCGLIAVAATAGAAGSRRRWDVAIFAASPLLVFHAFSNWDLLAMAFASAALWAWARNRPVAAGVLIGLGAAAKLYPALLLFPLVLLAYRSRTWRPVLWCIAGAVGSWLAVNLPVATAWGRGWWEFYSFSASRPAEASTFWAMLKHYNNDAFGSPASDSWTPPGVAVAFAFLAAMAIVGFLALRAPARPRLAQLAFLTVAAFLLTTKVWSPQYSVWLVPLLALARPRWRSALLWQASEIAVWIGTMLWLLGGSNPNKALNYEGLTWLLIVRDVMLLGLMASVAWQMWHPQDDPVREPASAVGAVGADPGEGLFAMSATDQRLVWSSVTRPFLEYDEDPEDLDRDD
jgi:uncharacterized membrane protein